MFKNFNIDSRHKNWHKSCSCSYGARKHLLAFEISTLCVLYYLYFCISASHTAVLCVNSSNTTCDVEPISETSCLHSAKRLRTVFRALLYLSTDILQMFNLKLMCSPTEVNGITKVLKVIPC